MTTKPRLADIKRTHRDKESCEAAGCDTWPLIAALEAVIKQCQEIEIPKVATSEQLGAIFWQSVSILDVIEDHVGIIREHTDTGDTE